MDVIGFGALNVDLSYEISGTAAEALMVGHGREREGQSLGSLTEILRQLETERLLGKSGGGSAANVVVALAGMGFQTCYIGKVGNDPEGGFLLSSLSRVDTSHVLRGKGRSGIVLAFQTQDQKDRSLFVFPGENDTIDPDNLNIPYLNQARVVHFTSFVGDRSFQAQIESLNKLDPRVLVSFDPGELYAKRGLTALGPFFRRSHIVFPSQEEVRIMTGENYQKGARQLLTLGPQIVVVKLGEQGCFVLTANEEFNIQAITLKQEEVIDTIGAGDVFVAGFLAGLLNGRPLRVCAEFANRIAAKKITGLGRTKYPTNKDLQLL